MRTLTFSRFDSIYDNKAKPETKTWPEWIEIFSKHRLIEADDSNEKELEKNKDIDCYVFGKILENMPRKNTRVQEANALVLDIEKIPDDKLEVGLEPLENFEYILYSTYRHRARCFEQDDNIANRFRIILPLVRGLNKSQFDRAWNALNLLTKKITDKQTKNISRAYYIPSTFDLDKAEFYHNKGDWISFAYLKNLPQTKKELDKRKYYTLDRLKSLLAFMPDNETTEDGLSLKDVKHNLLRGKPFAEAGYRHNAILAMTMYIARKTGSQQPKTEIVAKLFRKSIDEMQKKDPNSPSLDDVIRCYEGAIGKLVEYEQNNTEIKEEKAKNKQLRGQDPYDDDELTSIALKQNWKPEDLDRRWIIQKGISYYFLNEEGVYLGPFTKDEARPAAATILARAPIMINEPTRSGFRRKSMLELVEEYGQVASEVIADLTIATSSFDISNQTIREAVRPIRTDLVPSPNQEFDKCLKLLATDKYEKLLDWLACVPDLNKLLCALYLGGHPGSLKSGLAFGLARLWHKGPPAEIEKVLGDFTEALVFCPLILADEGLPKSWKGINITTKLRSMIATYQRILSRKYLPLATLNGAIRLILSANNEFLLRSTEVLSSADLQAVAQRFLYIEAHEHATKYLESLDRKVRDSWFEGDGIANHVLWLSKTRVVKPGNRFWVEGDVSHMHRMLLSGSDYNAMVCQWLVYYLMNPKQVSHHAIKGLIKIIDGKLLVNDQVLYDGWRIFFPDSRVEPSIYKIGAALRAISENDKIQLRYKNKRIRYRIIDLNSLFAWSENSNVGDKETMEVTLGLREPLTESELTKKQLVNESKILTLKDKIKNIKTKKVLDKL